MTESSALVTPPYAASHGYASSQAGAPSRWHDSRPVAAGRLLVPASAGFAVALGGTLLLTQDWGELDTSGASAVIACALLVWAYATVGLTAWARRPGNRMGALLVWCAVAAWCIGAGLSPVPGLLVAGTLGATLIVAAVAHLLLAFPSGRLQSSWARGVVVGLYLLLSVGQVSLYLLYPDTAVPSLGFSTLPGWGTGLGQAEIVIAAVLGVIVIVLLVVQWARADPAGRRTRGSVYGYGTVMISFMLASTLAAQMWFPQTSYASAWAQIVLLALLPPLVGVMFFRGGFPAATGLRALDAWMSAPEDQRESLPVALGRAFGDTSLRVGYWSGELSSWVDADGKPFGCARAGRGWVEIHTDRSAPVTTNRMGGSADDRAAGASAGGSSVGAASGVPVAVIDYDTALIAEPGEVARAGWLVRLVLERERLIAQLLASRMTVAASRRRLVGAVDAERHRIERALHDGVQARLVFLGVQTEALARTLPESEAAQLRSLRRELDETAAELRAFVRSVMPPMLIEHGLLGALRELSEQMPIPTTLTRNERTDSGLVPQVGARSAAAAGADPGLDSEVELTVYLVVAEALSNVLKHAHAKRVSITLDYQPACLGTGPVAGFGQETPEASAVLMVPVLRVCVVDDGAGGADLAGGTGLTGLRDRVATLGGSLDIRSEPGEGTTLCANIPVVPR